MRNIRKYDPNINFWWGKENANTDWAIQDKKGDWWLVSGSEFPEKKVERKKTMNCGAPPTFDFKGFFVKVFYAALLGVSLGINVFLLLTR